MKKVKVNSAECGFVLLKINTRFLKYYIDSRNKLFLYPNKHVGEFWLHLQWRREEFFSLLMLYQPKQQTLDLGSCKHSNKGIFSLLIPPNFTYHPWVFPKGSSPNSIFLFSAQFALYFFYYFLGFDWYFILCLLFSLSKELI